MQVLFCYEFKYQNRPCSFQVKFKSRRVNRNRFPARRVIVKLAASHFRITKRCSSAKHSSVNIYLYTTDISRDKYIYYVYINRSILTSRIHVHEK